ncbi:MAG: EAL domain-containing protein [Gallionella sp.]|nr:EAL domain-containing protein [Gallionella sp.]
MIGKEGFHVLFNLAADSMFIIDPDGFIREINQTAYARLGYTRDEMLGKHVREFILPESSALLAIRIAKAQSQEFLIYESAQVHKDGSILPIEVCSRAIVLEGKKLLFNIVRDIGERKRLDNALRESEARFRALAADAPEAILIHDLDTDLFIDATSSAERLFSCSREELLRHGPKHFVAPDQPAGSPSVETHVERGERALAGEQIKFERLVRDAKGKDVLCEVTLIRLPSEGRRLIRASYIDITERKQIENALRESEEKYRSLFEESLDGLFISNTEGNFIDINQKIIQIFGYDSKEEMLALDFEKDICAYPADKGNILAFVNDKGFAELEVIVKKKNGDRITTLCNFSAVKDTHGAIVSYRGMIRDITEKKKSEELIWRQANFDTLTSLPNRDMFHDRLGQEIKRSYRECLPLALLLIDLDHFKQVNDTLGHAMGDLLLQEAARRIRSCVRGSDTLARLGGDEFTVILSAMSESGHVEDVAQKIVGKLAQPFQLGSDEVFVSASIGITIYPSDADDIDSLMKNADQAMYVAKNKGRNRFSYFTKSLQIEAQNRLHMISDLRGALAAKQFSVHFQPVIELSTGQIRKAEALIRWNHPERGMVSPAEFIALAEEAGLINEIGDWVFREAARWASIWSDRCPGSCQMSVNMSPLQFQHGGRMCDEWVEYLTSLGLSGSNMVVEITEGLLLKAESEVTESLYRFRDAGIQVAIDDFGTGYSSLSYLKKFDIDYLKIDQSFVKNLESDVNNMALSEAIIVMAHKLGLKVIAEGVETKGQRYLLSIAGCDYAQGNLFSKPLPPDEFERLLEDNKKA